VLQDPAEQLLQARPVVGEMVALTADLTAGAFQFPHQGVVFALPFLQLSPQMRRSVGDLLDESLRFNPAVVAANIAVQRMESTFEFLGTLLAERLG